MLKLLMFLTISIRYHHLCGMKGSKQYSKKYPFVGKIVSGNGAVCVIDVDGVSLNKMNWEMFDRMFPGGGDADFESFSNMRKDAATDPFIKLLEDKAMVGSPVSLNFVIDLRVK